MVRNLQNEANKLVLRLQSLNMLPANEKGKDTPNHAVPWKNSRHTAGTIYEK